MLWALYCYVYYYTTVFRHSGELSHQRLENHTKFVPEVLFQWCNCTGSLHRCRCMCSAQDLVHFAQYVPVVSIYSKSFFTCWQCPVKNVKFHNFHFGAGLARSHVHYLHTNGAVGSGTASDCLASLKMYLSSLKM